MAKLILLIMFVTSIILILFPLKNRGNNLYGNPIKKSNPLYTVEYKNRYFYHDFFGEMLYVDDIKYPSIPIVNYSNDFIKELKIIREMEGIHNIIKIDFQKNEIICYNKVRIKYYDKEELKEFFKSNPDISKFKSGDYLLINKVLIEEDY
ncbi:MAG: hypothetical protein ACQESN_00205 [Thermotogota bacterium]